MKPTNETKKQKVPVEIDLGHEDALPGLRILIVEDMGLIAMELRRVLQRAGCEIVGVASRLSEALRIVQTTECLDGVLLDLNLSGEESYPVAEILHERGIPFIIMSGYDASNTRADCAHEAHLQKPFTNDDLAALMRRRFQLPQV